MGKLKAFRPYLWFFILTQLALLNFISASNILFESYIWALSNTAIGVWCGVLAWFEYRRVKREKDFLNWL